MPCLATPKIDYEPLHAALSELSRTRRMDYHAIADATGVPFKQIHLPHEPQARPQPELRRARQPRPIRGSPPERGVRKRAPGGRCACLASRKSSAPSPTGARCPKRATSSNAALPWSTSSCRRAASPDGRPARTATGRYRRRRSPSASGFLRLWKEGKAVQDRTRLDNYVVLMGHMVEDMGLSGNELVVYAIIYGFCQAGCPCECSLRYFRWWLGCSKSTAIRVLDSPRGEGLRHPGPKDRERSAVHLLPARAERRPVRSRQARGFQQPAGRRGGCQNDTHRFHRARPGFPASPGRVVSKMTPPVSKTGPNK